jgi:hypothetical protein
MRHRAAYLRAWTLPLLLAIAGGGNADADQHGHAHHSSGPRQVRVIHNFEPSSLTSPHGAVSKVKLRSDLTAVETGELAHHRDGMEIDFRFAEDVWILGYKTEIYDDKNQIPGDEIYLCHSFLGSQFVSQDPNQNFKGVFTDSFTRQVRLPEGFAVKMTPTDAIQWMQMFLNRTSQVAEVGMTAELEVIRNKDLKKPLRPVYSTLRSVQVPHLYYVLPGRDTRDSTFEMPHNGRIHYMNAHIHPYGESVELYNLTRDEQVWKGTLKTNAPGKFETMDYYSSKDGYPFKAGERFRLTGSYNNTTDEMVDAMAGVFIFYTLDEEQPSAPTTRPSR